MNQEEDFKKTFRQGLFPAGPSHYALSGTRVIRYFFLLILFSSLIINLPFIVQAEGYPIDPDNKFAWSSIGGWINHRTGFSSVMAYDTHLEGYAWSESIGLICMGTHTGGGDHTYLNTSATNYGVNNNDGNLSGFAWSGNAGWINFGPQHGGVTIDAITGDFSGYAWSESLGWISFSGIAADSTPYKVRILYPVFSEVTLFADPSDIGVVLEGDGTYKEGDTVEISADLPGRGWVFVEWTGEHEGLLANICSPSTYFIMPDHAVEFTAVFEYEHYDSVPAIISLENPSYKGIWKWTYNPSRSNLLDSELARISEGKSTWTWNRLISDHSASKILVADLTGNDTLEIILNLKGTGLCVYNINTSSWGLILPECIDFTIARTDISGTKQIIASDNSGTFVFDYDEYIFEELFTVPVDMLFSSDIYRNNIDELIMCFRDIPNLYVYSFVSDSASMLARVRPEQVMAGDLTGDGYNELICSFEGLGIYMFRNTGTKEEKVNNKAEFKNLMVDVPRNNEWVSNSRGWQIQRITYTWPMSGHSMSLGNITDTNAQELFFAYNDRTYYYSYGSGFHTLAFGPMKTIIAGRFTGQKLDDLIVCLSQSGNIYLRHAATGAWQLLVNAGNANFMITYALEDMQYEEASTIPRTGQTVTYRDGDDGHYQMGVEWPCQRFTDHCNGTVTDNLTGLMWTKDANLAGQKTWEDAVDWCNDLVHGGHSDWRLPNVLELYSLIDISEYDNALPDGHPFLNVQNQTYWSSTTYAADTYIAWNVGIGLFGDICQEGKSTGMHVWAVRDTSNGVTRVPKTGQTISYRPGDDGYYQMGAVWPDPRFTDNDDGTVTDNLTGLMWTKDANLPNSTKNWNSAINYCNDLVHGGHTDWRLPNVRELQSLIHYGEEFPAISQDHPFIRIEPFDYWASSTSAVSSFHGWLVFMYRGSLLYYNKASTCYVWPVRGGQ